MHVIYCKYMCVNVSTLVTIMQECRNQGQIQDFLKGGSESGVDIEGGTNPSIVSLKQGVWGI